MFTPLKKQLLTFAVVIPTTLLTACNDSDKSDESHIIFDNHAVIQTVASDYQSSQVVTINRADQTLEEGFYTKETSGYTISADDNSLYHIGQWNIDTIAKYNLNSAENAQWEFSTNEASVATSSNPYTLVSVSDTKAYLIRYGSSNVWIVNPQGTTIDTFKLGELDLSNYVPADNSSGTPGPSAAVVTDGKLFVTMQRLSDAWSANTAYVAVFDINTDEEIETNADDSDAVKGIPLVGVNPLSSSIIAFGDSVYIATKNKTTDLAKSAIEEINTATFATRKVISSDEIDNNTDGGIKSVQILSATRGYFVLTSAINTAPWSYESVYEFNPTTGEVITAEVFGYSDTQLNYIALDNENNLWISVNDSTPGVDVYETENNSLLFNRVTTTLVPNKIVFVSQ